MSLSNRLSSAFSSCVEMTSAGFMLGRMSAKTMMPLELGPDEAT